MLTILETKQQRFSELMGKLIEKAIGAGYGISMGETYRPPEMAAIYAKEGKGIKDSLHCDRLAVDINLWRGDQYLRDTASYKDLGAWWEQQDRHARWGGRWEDGNHFELTLDGGNK